MMAPVRSGFTGPLVQAKPARPDAASFLEDLARISFPNRGERGRFVMLECYFDDSGTHGTSRVVVWGGIVGHKDFMRELEAAWKARLAEPCEGKPPIRKFSSADLLAGREEFEGYNDAEKDRTRYLFRQVILDAGLSVLSYGASVTDWDQIMTGPARAQLGSAERFAFGQAIMHGCNVSKNDGVPVSFQFDLGRKFPDLDSMIHPALEASEIDQSLVSYGYSAVLGNMGLQAADLVAHETYQHLVKYVDNPKSAPGVHLKSLWGGAHDSRMYLAGRTQIQEMLDDLTASLRKIDPSWP